MSVQSTVVSCCGPDAQGGTLQMHLLPEDDIILQGLIKGQPVKNTPIHRFHFSSSLTPSISPLSLLYSLSLILSLSVLLLFILPQLYTIHSIIPFILVSFLPYILVSFLPCILVLSLAAGVNTFVVVAMNVITDVTIIQNKKRHVIHQSSNTSQVN